MNPINRVGQKVECIAGFTIETCDGDVFGPGAKPNHTPQVGQTYTVDGFLATGHVIDLGILTRHGPGIVLREIAAPTCDCCSKKMGWPIIAFRPLLDRETDISALVEAGKRTDLLTRADDELEIIRSLIEANQ